MQDVNAWYNQYSYQTRSRIIKQYLDIKYHHQDHLLLFRIGDFYELLFEDAIKASKMVDLQLTKRKSKPHTIPMCGFPKKALYDYVKQLVHQGFLVALCNETEQKNEQNLIIRKVERIFTPGTISEEEIIDNGEFNFLGAVCFIAQKNQIELVYADLGLGETFASTLELDRLHDELARLDLKEIVCLDDAILIHEQITKAYGDHFRISMVKNEACMPINNAFALLKHYLRLVQLNIKLKTPNKVIQNFAKLNASTIAHLELFKNSKGLRSGTLFNFLNTTRTKAGSRLLKYWLIRPLNDIRLIQRRQEEVLFCYIHHQHLRQIQEMFSSLGDLPRILHRISQDCFKTQDLFVIKKSVEAMLKIKNFFHQLLVQQDCQVAQQLSNESGCKIGGNSVIFELIDGIELDLELHDLLNQALIDDIHSEYKTSVIKPNYHPKLEHFMNDFYKLQKRIDSLSMQYQKLSGINSLEIRFNAIHGFLIYIKSQDAHKMNASVFQHVRNIKNEVEYTTAALTEIGMEAVYYRNAITQLEKTLCEELFLYIKNRTDGLKAAGNILAHLDVIIAFGMNAAEHQYVVPTMLEERVLELNKAFHPIISEKLSHIGKKFYKNDYQLTQNNRLWVITGSNMSGKSTLLRQSALIVVLAHIGSFVPASSARIGVFDQIFTRIGSGDDVMLGYSTFMLEMRETAEILNNATQRSFIVIDEIGRGTNWKEGFALARAILEYIHNTIGCLCLFATHYLEIQEMNNLAGLSFYRFTQNPTKKLDANQKCDEDDLEWTNANDIHQLEPGVAQCADSLKIAQLAMMPKQVLELAASTRI